MLNVGRPFPTTKFTGEADISLAVAFQRSETIDFVVLPSLYILYVPVYGLPKTVHTLVYKVGSNV